MGSRTTTRDRLQWLIALRVAVATLLLGGAITVALVEGRPLDGFTPRASLLLVATSYAVSASFAIWLIKSGPRRASAIAQVSFDLALTTALVYLSGGVGSVLTVLFGVTVLEAAITLGRGAARVTAGVALSAQLALGYAVATGLLGAPPDQDPRHFSLEASELGFALLSNGVALLLVAILAGSLAERLRDAGGRLEEVEASAARLAQLNADIVGSLNAGLVTLDAEDVVMSANPAALSILGVTDDRPLLGGPLSRCLPGVTEGRGETETSGPGGAPIVIGYTRTPLTRAEGESLLLFQDLTELRELRAQAERAERHAVLGRLASGLAHEIRNPLGSISGSVQLVRESTALDAEDRHLLGVVLDEVERLNELVTSMLDVGRRREARKAKVDLTRLARDLVAVARGDTTLARVQLQLEAPEELTAEVDANQVRQLLWNLLKNAVQASPSEGVVRIRLWSEGAVVLLEVEDQGPGIMEPDRSRLFDMFWSKRSHGIGLGLALVKQITDAHDGTVTVDEGADGGTRFRVALPAGAPDARA